MNYLTRKKIIFTPILVYILMYSFGHAATIVIESPVKASPNRSPVIVRVMLDPEKDILSGMSGNFSFPSDMFDVGAISTESSVVSLWIKQPTVTDEKYLDGRTHISFEGIFPGGYDGVRSPYYKGVRPGKVFSVALLPKNKGEGTLLVDDVLLNAFNSEATPLATQKVTKKIENPTLIEQVITKPSTAKEVESPTLTAFISQDALIDTNAWHLIVSEREQRSSIAHIYIAETDNYTASLVGDYVWRKVSVPYVLSNQRRTKYVHVKVEYSNNTYTLRTLPPVENSQSIPLASRILLSVALALLGLYIYGNFFFTPRSKQEQPNSKST